MVAEAKERVIEFVEDMEMKLDEDTILEIAIMLDEVDNDDEDYSDEKIIDVMNFLGIKINGF